MYFSKIPEGDSDQDFYTIAVDDRVFYAPRPMQAEAKSPPRRRLSDQYRDSSFIAKDTFRKLNMIKTYRMKHRNIEEVTERHIKCIEECILVLKNEFDIEAKTIFQAFDLIQLGIRPEDFGVMADECISDVEG